jgi:hypothetical protein
LHTPVTVRIYEREIEILDDLGEVLRRHETVGRGQYVLADEDRLFNPSRETARLLVKAHKIGPQASTLAHNVFSRLGRPGQRAIYGLTNLVRHHARADIEAACASVLTSSAPSYQAVKRLLERRAAATIPADTTDVATALTQTGDAIRPVDHYQRFFEQHAEGTPPTPPPTERNPR